MSVERKVDRKSVTRAMRLVLLDEFLRQPDFSWHVRDLLPVGSFCVVFGAPKAGKTFAVCDLAMHAAHGMRWRGYTVSRPLRVAFLAGEGRSGLRLRLKAWIAEHGAELNGNFALLAESLGLPQHADEVVVALREHKPDLVVIDTLNAFFGGGDENSTQDMTAFTNAVRQVIDDVGCSIIVIHHTGLTDATRARGSSVLRGAADVVVQVAKDEKRSGLIAFQVVEGRDIEAWAEPLALKLRRVDTDWTDDDGVRLSTCVVESSDQPVTLPGRRGKALSDAQQMTVAAVRDLAAKANGGTEVILARSDIVAAAVAKGVNRTVVYRNMSQLAERMNWQIIESGNLKVRRQ